MTEPTIVLAASARPGGPPVRLTVVAGRHEGVTWTFDRAAEVTIGRDAPAQLRLPQEQAMSLQHLRLRIEPPRAELTDAQSRNGTFVNGVRVAAATLGAGDRFGVGDTEILFEVLAGPLAPSGDDPQLTSPLHLPKTPDHGPAPRVDKSGDLHDRSIAGGGKMRGGRPPSPEHGRDPENWRDQAAGTGAVASHGPETFSLLGQEQWDESAPPESVGPYDLGRFLGRGGMASVFHATHRRTGESFAVKLIRSDLTPSARQLQLFVREAGVLTRLDHPRIVKALEFGIEGDTPYLVMEYLETVDLLGLFDGMPPNQKAKVATWTISRVLQALHYAHRQGVVHRDIKPANLLAFREGRRLQVKLADFGLAKTYVDAGFSGLTSDRSLRGTLAYMAPEQFEDARGAGPAEDLFSCGACLFRMLTGQLPNMVFKPRETLRLLAEEQQITPQLHAIIRKSLALDPKERFQSADEFATAIFPFHGRR